MNLEVGVATASTRPSAKSFVSHTSLPKVTLSHKWVIRDVKILLESVNLNLRSPTFSLPLPTTKQSSEEISDLYLLIANPTDSDLSLSVFLCQEGKGNFSAPSQHFSFTPVQRQNVVTFLISDCTFSILDPRADTTKKIAKVAARECVVGNSLTDFGINHFLKRADFDEYLSEDTLTLKVDATFTFISAPVETLGEACSVPPDNLREGVHSLLENELLSDVVVKCGGKEFKAHKVVLASQSPVFKKMFEVDMKEKRSNAIEISDVSPTVVSELLAYFYSGSAPNLKTLARELLSVSNKYEIPRLLVMCENELMMNITIDNVVEVLQLAEMHQASNLKLACFKLMKCNSTEVYKSDAWKEFRSNFEPSLLFELLEYSSEI